MAFLFASPRLLGKQACGHLHPIAWLVYWPYILLSIAILKLYARLSSEPAVSQITPHLLLGRRLSSHECSHHLPDNLAGTVDLTAEFAEPADIRRQDYFCIPTIDTLNPSLEQLQSAVAFIDTHQGDGPVFLHCAMGHGRSATIAAAYLMHSQALTPAQAVHTLKSIRPGVELHPEQSELLVEYEQSTIRFDVKVGESCETP